MKKKPQQNKEYSPRFELVLKVRNHEGKETGKTVSYTTDNSEHLEEFFQRNCYREKKVNNEKPKTGRHRTKKRSTETPETDKNT